LNPWALAIGLVAAAGAAAASVTGPRGVTPEGPGDAPATTARLDLAPANPRPRTTGFFLGISSGVQADPNGIPREFYFSRVAYSGYGRGYYGRGGSWAVDFPKADRQFLIVLERLVKLDIYSMEHPVVLDDPEVRKFPFLYALEVGGMALTPPEVEGLRSYLLAGGFLVIDDFWGTREWENFELEIRRVLPEYPIVDLDLEHPLFSSFYDIDEILQVPGFRQGTRGGPTWERDGYEPHVRGIFDDLGRLMVVINFNTDLVDAWEWAENPYYPLRYSTYAYEMGVNMIVYAMSH
jgi:hypothetical protein